VKSPENVAATEGESPTPFADAARDAKANATKKIDD
jgi:hypothetical protein